MAGEHELAGPREAALGVQGEIQHCPLHVLLERRLRQDDLPGPDGVVDQRRSPLVAVLELSERQRPVRRIEGDELAVDQSHDEGSVEPAGIGELQVDLAAAPVAGPCQPSVNSDSLEHPIEKEGFLSGVASPLGEDFLQGRAFLGEDARLVLCGDLVADETVDRLGFGARRTGGACNRLCLRRHAAILSPSFGIGLFLDRLADRLPTFQHAGVEIRAAIGLRHHHHLEREVSERRAVRVIRHGGEVLRPGAQLGAAGIRFGFGLEADPQRVAAPPHGDNLSRDLEDDLGEEDRDLVREIPGLEEVGVELHLIPGVEDRSHFNTGESDCGDGEPFAPRSSPRYKNPRRNAAASSEMRAIPRCLATALAEVTTVTRPSGPTCARILVLV